MPSATPAPPKKVTRRAPAKYSGTWEPGTLLTTVLTSGVVRVAISNWLAVRAASATSPPGISSENWARSCAPVASAAALDAAVDSCTAARRWRGSATSVPAVTIIADTWLPAVPACSAVRVEIGAITRSACVRQLAVLAQVLTQRAADDGDGDVVDRRPGHGGLDRLGGGQLEPAGLDDPVRRDDAAEPGPRRRRDRAQVEVLAGPLLAHPLGVAGHGRGGEASHAHRPHGGVDGRPRQQLERAGQALRHATPRSPPAPARRVESR